MEVQQNVKAKFLRRRGRSNRIVQVVGQTVGSVGRSVENPKPHPVVAMRLENLQNRSRHSVVLEDDSLLLRLPREGYIGANRVLLPLLRMTAAE